MKDVVSPSYDRAPSERLRQLLAPDGFLSPLLAKRTVAGVDLEIHLRPGDKVDLYCGLTCLVKGGRSHGGTVWIESHRRYAGQPCASGLFRPGRTRAVNRGNYLRDEWEVGEPGFAQALDTFLSGVGGRSEADEGGGGSGPVVAERRAVDRIRQGGGPGVSVGAGTSAPLVRIVPRIGRGSATRTECAGPVAAVAARQARPLGDAERPEGQSQARSARGRFAMATWWCWKSRMRPGRPRRSTTRRFSFCRMSGSGTLRWTR